MGRSKKKSFSITLILSIIFAVICIIAVWNVKVGDHEKGLQPDYVEPETETMPYESIKPPTEEKTDKIIPEQEKSEIDRVIDSPQVNEEDIEQEVTEAEKVVDAIDTELAQTLNSFFKELNCHIGENWVIDVPSIYSLTWIERRLNNILAESGYRIDNSKIYLNDKEILELKFNKMPSKGKIAIIIDDVGRTTRLNTILQEIKLPLNISILPKQRETTSMSTIGKKGGWDVLLHLPMEPKEKSWIDSTFIKVGMDSEEVKERIDDYLKEMSYVQGVNNHMGSLATSDENIMRTVLGIVREKGLYFIDSLTISNSVGEKVAREIGLERFAKRDIFLDNTDEKEYIRSQIDHLVELSIRKGFAIGIGHLRENTLTTIKDYDWNTKGVELVPLSDVL